MNKKLIELLRESIDLSPVNPGTVDLIKYASEAAAVLEMYENLDFQEIKDDLIFLAAHAGTYPERIKEKYDA